MSKGRMRKRDFRLWSGIREEKLEEGMREDKACEAEDVVRCPLEVGPWVG